MQTNPKSKHPRNASIPEEQQGAAHQQGQQDDHQACIIQHTTDWQSKQLTQQAIAVRWGAQQNISQDHQVHYTEAKAEA
jgi:hypothetical protein